MTPYFANGFLSWVESTDFDSSFSSLLLLLRPDDELMLDLFVIVIDGGGCGGSDKISSMLLRSVLGFGLGLACGISSSSSEIRVFRGGGRGASAIYKQKHF